MLAEAIVMVFSFLMYFLPLSCGLVCLFLFIKKLGEKIIDLVPVRKKDLQYLAPVVQKVVIRKRVIDLKNRLAMEVSLEATPEQVRSIFRDN